MYFWYISLVFLSYFIAFNNGFLIAWFAVRLWAWSYSRVPADAAKPSWGAAKPL
jgi:hypothetical protein